MEQGNGYWSRKLIIVCSAYMFIVIWINHISISVSPFRKFSFPKKSSSLSQTTLMEVLVFLQLPTQYLFLYIFSNVPRPHSKQYFFFYLHHLLTTECWVNYLSSSCFNVLVYKVKIVIVYISLTWHEHYNSNINEALRIKAGTL